MRQNGIVVRRVRRKHIVVDYFAEDTICGFDTIIANVANASGPSTNCP
jgi:hypothetical protein